MNHFRAISDHDIKMPLMCVCVCFPILDICKKAQEENLWLLGTHENLVFRTFATRKMASNNLVDMTHSLIYESLIFQFPIYLEP